MMTSLGIVSAVLVHMTYCILGLAVVIANSLILFNTVKYIGAAYLIYIGIGAFRTRTAGLGKEIVEGNKIKEDLSDWAAFRQGFLCNLLNPKATLFFLALFTVIIKPDTPTVVQLAYGLQMTVLAGSWFCFLSVILSHRRVVAVVDKMEVYVEKILGVLLIGFGVALALVKH
jgi:threonine/homoserine/homoserine lactone efflux protein